MKSGTSFVQNVLAENKELLAERGVLFPGERWLDQISAVKDLIGFSPDTPLADDGPWRQLAAEVHAWPGTAVISMEFLAPRTPAQIAEIVRTYPRTRVEAVMSCRDLARNTCAMWLESVQNASSTGWADFLEAVRTDDRSEDAGRTFWRHQDLPAIARRWSQGLGHDRFTLLTVPQRGAAPDLLWRRFAQVLDTPADGVDLDVLANPSIGLATAQVLRALNERIVVDGKTPPRYDRLVKHVLAKRGLVHRHGVEPRLGLDEPWVLERGLEQVEKLRTARYRVVGDLLDLTPRPVPGVHADEVSERDQLDAALDGLAHVVQQWGKATRRADRQARKAAEESED
jgi:hypothetical protein